MTLLIACLIINGLNMPGWLYALATAVWVVKKVVSLVAWSATTT